MKDVVWDYSESNRELLKARKQESDNQISILRTIVLIASWRKDGRQMWDWKQEMPQPDESRVKLWHLLFLEAARLSVLPAIVSYTGGHSSFLIHIRGNWTFSIGIAILALPPGLNVF